MILSPLRAAEFDGLAAAFAAGLADDPLAAAVFAAILRVPPAGDLATLSTDPRHHAEAVELCRSFGFGLLDLAPQDHFTWDGAAVAIRIEPSVLIHEIGHYQLAAPARRGLYDFGLGAGPETGRKAEADAVQALFLPERDVEEGLCSLLGILWEAELGQPAVLALLEQNWLEGGASPHNLAHFRKIVRWLAAMGLIDPATARPTRALRQEDDGDFFARWYREG